MSHLDGKYFVDPLNTSQITRRRILVMSSQSSRFCVGCVCRLIKTGHRGAR
uniref:Uncharacterized protein n=1 Tax=Anguilla anguilla TaxID=7936 RepID=A0A0E9WSG0_ANGAN